MTECPIDRKGFLLPVSRDGSEIRGFEVLERYVERAETAVSDQLDAGTAPHLVRLRRLYEGWIESFRTSEFSQGCLAGSMCQEMAGREPAFRQALDGSFERMRKALVVCLQRAQEADELGPRHDPDRLARFMFDAWQGAVMRMKVERTDRPLRDYLEMVFGRLLTA